MAFDTVSSLRRDGGIRPPRNRREHVLDELGQLIVAGSVSPGAALPIEPALCAQFGVSKTVIREAVRGLAAKGLVYTSPRLGTVVCPRDDWHLLDPDVLAWRLRAGTGPRALRDFEEFRRAVEPMGARLAAQRATKAEKELMQAAFERMQDNADIPEKYLAADLDFHTALLTATDNEVLRALRDTLRAALAVRHESAAKILNDMRESMPYHEAVLHAVDAGKPDQASTAMDKLLALSIRDDTRLQPRRRAATQPRKRSRS